MREGEFSRESTLIVKGVAILFLLQYHLFGDAVTIADLQVDYRPFPLEGFLTFSKFGNVSVAVFVFLTAYGITRGLMEQEGITARNMYRQALWRMLRLMAGFAALYASVTLVWMRWFDFPSLYGEGKQGLLYMLADGMGLAQILDTPTLNMTWWYMEIAYALIFLAPLLHILVQKIGYSLLPVMVLVPILVELNPDISRYLFTAAVGVCAAYGNWPGRMLKIRMRPALGWTVGCAGLALCVMIRQNFFVQERFLHLADGGMAVFLVWFSTALPGSVPVVKKVLGFIGRYSMNIYLAHTFFYMILWRHYIYAFRYAGAILTALLLASLAWSVALEQVKTGVLWLIKKLIKKRKEKR